MTQRMNLIISKKGLVNMEDNQKIVQKAEKFIRKYASMIGHDHAKDLMDLVHLAKKQEIEISRLSSIESYAEFIKDDKNYTQLVFENAELTNFKKTTEEVVGDVILELIEERMAD
jgi:predicted nucleotidyltransferase component of viral defense system